MLGRVRRLIETTGENKVCRTPRSEKALQMACLEARQLDHDRVDTEHLLLGLSRGPGVGAARILSDLGVGYEDVRRRIPETRTAGE